MKLNKTFKIKSHGDCRVGLLSPMSCKDIPYDIKRIFWVTDPPKGTVRGKHSHIKCWQTYACLKGKILIESNDGRLEDSITLNKNDAIIIPPLLWTSEKFLTGEDMLLVACSHEYDPEDYIFDPEKLTLYER